jgi:plastocyanin
MGQRFIVSVIVVFGAAAIIGVVAARNQPSPAAAVVPTPLPTPLPTPAPHSVDILPDPSDQSIGMYQPASLTVSVGEKVTWVNLDTKAHTAIADNGAFSTAVIAPGEKASWVPSKPGTYTYSCYIDPDMHGTIVVKP